MYTTVSIYISRIYLALKKSITGFFKTPMMHKVIKFSDILEFLSKSQLTVSFFLEGSDIIKLLFNSVLKYIEKNALEKLNTKLLYHKQLNHIPLHFTD